MTSKPLGAFRPVPTAVPPSASSFSSGRASSSIFLSFSSEARQPLISWENLIGRSVLQVGAAGLDDALVFLLQALEGGSISWSIAGKSLSSMAMTAEMCIAVGKVSLEDWLMLMSSLGCSSFLPAISLPRLAMTSLAFMLDCVPEPVCQTTSGKCSFERCRS